MTRRSCAIYTVGVICALLLVSGIALMVAQVFRNLMHKLLKKEIVLVEGSRVFESWKSPPPPVFMEFFFFNVTNVEEVLSGKKPEVNQIGPYTYREYRYKDNVTMLDNNTKVSAYNAKSFVFLRDKSVGDPDVDNITTVNIPIWAAMNKAPGYKSFFLNIMIKGTKSRLFTTRSVQELLWGYEDALLDRIASSGTDVERVFGLMYKKNESSDGEFVFHTGTQNYLDYARIETYKGERMLKYWSTNESNSILGSDGSAFHPLLNKSERLYVFSPDLCRTIYMEFEKDVEVKGIPAYRFTPPRSVLASKEENPANKGFCVTPKECLGTGVLKVSPCRKGAPVVASFPHFYLGEDKYIEAIGGMAPQSHHHQTFLDLNPTTGVIVRASKRAQVNILINRMSGYPDTKLLKETVFPVMFLNESVVIDDASAAKVNKLLMIVKVGSNFPLIIVGLSGIMLIVFIILLIRAHQQKKRVKRIVFTKAAYATATEEDISYSPANTKEKDDGQNGNYIGMTTKTEQ
ncbi:lysosome membrane protein 2 isoform X1 [Xiphophorus maculatus]|uniref:Lysosome membrane protein 2 n=1 Tax=Xiphophorus maculatus TaxID=8083 RepID=A0A3B5PUG3_XIPMA|nr:lysosome membrane protein 2 isoform X1 [Xiphophorus maculatus]